MYTVQYREMSTSSETTEKPSSTANADSPEDTIKVEPPAPDSTDGTTKPASDSTTKPAFDSTDGTIKPASDSTDGTTKPASDSTAKPASDSTDGTIKPASDSTDGTTKPASDSTDGTTKPASDSTAKPAPDSTDCTTKPASSTGPLAEKILRQIEVCVWGGPSWREVACDPFCLSYSTTLVIEISQGTSFFNKRQLVEKEDVSNH